MLKSKNSKYFSNICEEVLRYIKIEYYNKSRSKYILASIINNFAGFVLNNMKIMHYTFKPDRSKKFSLLEIFTEKENLKQILEFFTKLKKYYKSDSLISSYIFSHKLFVKEYIKGYKFPDIFIYALKYIKKNRERFGSLLANNLLIKFNQYLEMKKPEVEKLQFELNLKNIDTFVKILWS